ncbi:MAG: hypothetical protein JW863_11765 [Chitinispirillaceae bacterium]|nr:hypothetical protein [Chitinispirillaceae bacterium]
MAEQTINAIITGSIQEFLTVYREKLSSVAFPDISLEILENTVQEVLEKGRQLEENKKKVEEAQQVLEAVNENLQQKCSRGLAYAKIYAEGDPALSAQLASINLGRAGRSAKRVVSGEKRKNETGVTPQKQKRNNGEEKKEPVVESASV